jgi:chitodextrinase
MGWQTPPTAEGESAVTMTAVTATDDSGYVEYYFTCVAGEKGCVDSGWQTGTSYTLQGLDSGTYYAFKVVARDANGNLNSASPTSGVTTDAAPEIPQNKPPVAVIAYDEAQTIIQKGNSTDVVLAGSDSYDPDGSIVSWKWTDDRGSTVGSAQTISLTLRAGTYNFSLRVIDDQGDEATATVSLTVAKPESNKPPRGKKK